MSFQNLKDAITAVVTSNGNNEITGQILRELLNLNVIPQLGALQLKGIAVPATAPGAVTGVAQYLASENGNYVNFGAQEVSDEIALFTWNSTTSQWDKQTLFTLGQLTIDQDQIDIIVAAIIAEIGNRLIPAGGTTGQGLLKTSNNDYAMNWGDVAAGGAGSNAAINVIAKKNNSQLIEANTIEDIIFDQEDTDAENEYNPLTGIYTADSDGMRVFNAQIAYKDPDTGNGRVNDVEAVLQVDSGAGYVEVARAGIAKDTKKLRSVYFDGSNDSLTITHANQVGLGVDGDFCAEIIGLKLDYVDTEENEEIEVYFNGDGLGAGDLLVAGNTIETLIFDTVLKNSDLEYDSATGIITAKNAGTFDFHIEMSHSGNSNLELVLEKDTGGGYAEIARGTTASGIDSTSVLNFPHALNAGDLVRVRVDNLTGTNARVRGLAYYSNNRTFMSINKYSDYHSEITLLEKWGSLDAEKNYRIYYDTATSEIALKLWDGVEEVKYAAKYSLKKDIFYTLSLSFDAAADILSVYINGVSIADIAAPIAAIVIGTGNINVGTNLKGKVSSIRFWGATKTEQEIQDKLNLYTVGDETDLTAAWVFDGNYDNLVSDDNDLTVTGNPVFTYDSSIERINTVVTAFEYPVFMSDTHTAKILLDNKSDIDVSIQGVAASSVNKSFLFVETLLEQGVENNINWVQIGTTGAFYAYISDSNKIVFRGVVEFLDPDVPAPESFFANIGNLPLTINGSVVRPVQDIFLPIRSESERSIGPSSVYQTRQAELIIRSDGVLSVAFDYNAKERLSDEVLQIPSSNDFAALRYYLYTEYYL